MDELKIKSQSFPERCEICHKNDKFDSERNVCYRCKNLAWLITKKLEHKKLILNCFSIIFFLANISLCIFLVTMLLFFVTFIFQNNSWGSVLFLFVTEIMMKKGIFIFCLYFYILVFCLDWLFAIIVLIVSLINKKRNKFFD